MSLITNMPSDGIVTINRVILKEGFTVDDLEERVATLCSHVKTMHSGIGIDGLGGFVGGFVVRNSGQISIEGSSAGKAVSSEMKDKEFLIITFWESFEAHEASHKHDEFNSLFNRVLEISESAEEPVYQMMWMGAAYTKEEAEIARKTYKHFTDWTLDI